MCIRDSSDDDPFNTAYWDRLIAVREAVSKELEKLRVAGGIGSGLDAELDLYCDGALATDLGKLEDELRFFFITSYARLQPLSERPTEVVEIQTNGQSLAIRVLPTTHAKCCLLYTSRCV